MCWYMSLTTATRLCDKYKSCVKFYAATLIKELGHMITDTSNLEATTEFYKNSQ